MARDAEVRVERRSSAYGALTVGISFKRYVLSPGGAKDLSPRREPWGNDTKSASPGAAVLKVKGRLHKATHRK
ncbi:MAG TPA: hypothetical protein VG269_05245, partial [Tepidisphaeraceae bacterium]|nr:hypothetical protein [Tepidisphaeraceae bacterium]